MCLFIYILFLLFCPIVVILVFLVCRCIIKITNAAKWEVNNDNDTDTEWTDNDIQPALPAFEQESVTIKPIDENCSEFHSFSLFFDRD